MQKKIVIWLMIILCLGFILRFSNIYTAQYWFDESFEHQASIRPLKFLFTNPPPDVHPPGSYIMLHFWYDIVGFNDPYKSRWFSLVFGMAFLAILFMVSRKWYGERTALVTSFLAATGLTFIAYSVEARMYCMVIPLGLLSLYCLKEQKWAGFVFSAGSMIYFHYYTVFILIPIAVFWYFLKLPFKKIFWSMFGVGLLWLPVVVYFFLQSYGIRAMWLHRPYLLSWVSAPAFQFFIPSSQAFSNLQLPTSVMSVLPFLFLFVLLGYLFLVDYKDRLNKAMLWSWSLTIAVMMALAYFPPNIPYHHRFLLFLSPLFFLLLGQAVSNAWEKSKAVFVALLVVWFGIQMFMYVDYYSHVDHELQYASEFLKSVCPAVVLHESPFSLLPLRSTNPGCRHVLETELSYNSLRTGGGAVIGLKDFNNASVKPEYYVYGDELINCSQRVGKGERVVLNRCVTSFRPASSLLANGSVVFNESGLIIVKVDSWLKPPVNRSVEIKKFLLVTTE